MVMEHERQDHHQVFHHQPADRDPAIARSDHAPRFERAQQHNRTRNRQRQSKDNARAERPIPQVGEAGAEGGGHHDLRERSGQRHPPHGEKVAHGKMHSHAEHQKDHAYLRQLRRQSSVRNEPRREWPHGDACQKIAHEWRQTQSDREQSADKGERQTHRNRGNQRDFMDGCG
jgi:hypothetical protein